AAEKGIPVIIMEPLRGGKLVNLLPEPAKRLIAKYGNGWTPAELAFRWLYDQPEVTCVLSGMNSVEMVKENCRVASDAKAGGLSARDRKLIAKVKEIIRSREKVGCTGCRYCMPCPKGVDIPGTFSSYNMCASEGYISSLRDHLMNTALRQNCTGALNCVECGRCEKHCPQHIEIRKELKNARKKLEGPIYRISSWVIRKFRLY
ncbi:MAG: 4Fe-4S dicluster domain-containing protein, partial [Lachnospiraceae bacterium]|nr:4Fe-4S dicluster domain-containing protein [Lachnospiraceae bacterium]